MILQALEQLRPGCKVQVKYNNDGTYDVLSYEHPEQQPTEQELNSKLVELRQLEPMRLLREERSRRLMETDWWTSRAFDGVAMSQEQIDYRQALRDIPSISSPKIDENGQLINVTWPTKPE